MKAADKMSFTLMPDGDKSISDLAGLLFKKGRKALPVEQLSR